MSIPSITNCPNCGAPIDSDKCPYCGTRLINIAELEPGEKIWLIFKDNQNKDIVCASRVLVKRIGVSMSQDSTTTFYADGEPFCYYNPTADICIEIDGVLTKNSKGFFGIAVNCREAEDQEIRHYI